MIKLAPSILSADFNRLGEQISEISKAGAEYLHIDVMDGKFVPNISIGIPVIKSIRKETDIIFDVHLMIEEPIRYIKEFADCGADIITIHHEACTDVSRTIKMIRECGCKVGLSIKPNTPIEAIKPYADEVDLVLVMTVEPGFGGQKLIPVCMNKVESLQAYKKRFNLNYEIEVDGGVTLENAESLVNAGAEVIVSGSSVFKGSITENINSFKEVFNNALK